jgi:hypothetical protein
MKLSVDRLKELKELALREHYHCEDSWYSCPKAEGGCADDRAGDNCNCRVDEHNEKVEKLYNKIIKS